MTFNKGNLLSGACLAAFGTYVITVARKLPYISDVGPGPGFFPLWLGIGLVFFSFWLMVASFSASEFLSTEAKNKTPESWKSGSRALAGWLAMIVAIALLGKIGFGLSFVALTVFLIAVLDRRPLLLSLAVAVGLAIGFHLLFVLALDVSLPPAPWGFDLTR